MAAPNLVPEVAAWAERYGKDFVLLGDAATAPAQAPPARLSVPYTPADCGELVPE